MEGTEKSDLLEFGSARVILRSTMAAVNPSTYWKSAKKIIGIGRNYADHAKGMNRTDGTHNSQFKVSPSQNSKTSFFSFHLASTTVLFALNR
jgi:2-keto-4-pentenoate hydratase/2-oxohepta-3-ene-1,7-dioic acid hydratase in catechol pathway